jgi:hypothetical protein
MASSAANPKAIVAEAAGKYGISPSILWGLYGTETSFGKDVSTSSAGAVGPFQFEPATAKGLGVDPYDFKSAAFGAAKYLSQYKSRGVGGMLSAYNAGPAGGYQSGYVDTTLQNAKSYGNGEKVSLPAQSPASKGATLSAPKLPGIPATPSKEVTSLDKPAFEKAQKASIVGKLLASEPESGGNPLLSSGLATTVAPVASEYQTTRTIPGTPVASSASPAKAQPVGPLPAGTGRVPDAKGAIGFTPGPGTNYTYGKESEIAERANKLAVALGLKLTGVSGYRSPQHSVAVGGFADDPHTRGEASDTPGIESVPEAVLNKYGLERPFSKIVNGEQTDPKEADHIQLLGSYKGATGTVVATHGPENHPVVKVTHGQKQGQTVYVPRPSNAKPGDQYQG